MGRKARNLAGQVFGRWTVLSLAERPEGTTQTGLFWNCICECGTEKVVYGTSLVNRGGSCGCLKRERASVTMSKMRIEKCGTQLERFLSRFKVASSGCWVWQSHTDKDGYGILPATGAAIRAHRFSYVIHKGLIPDGMLVCHTCDNPSCVNPEHLFLGTAKDNIQDMISKERDRMVGERNNKAKLSNDDVIKIKSSTLLSSDLANIYGVCKSTINRARRRK